MSKGSVKKDKKKGSKENNEVEQNEFDSKLKEEDFKSEEEIKVKESKDNGDGGTDKDQEAFFERLKNRLENKDRDRVGSISQTQKENNGVEFLRRLSVAIPNVINRQNTKTIQKELFSKQNSIIPKLSRSGTLRNLPDTVRQPSFVKQIEQAKRQNSNLLTDEKINVTQTTIEEKKHREAIKHLDKFLDSTVVIVIMAIATVFVLIGDDIKTLSLPYTVDFAFDCTKTVCFGLFLLEILFSCIAKRDYILSFFFWLDLISTLSLIQDIDFMINPLIYGATST